MIEFYEELEFILKEGSCALRQNTLGPEDTRSGAVGFAKRHAKNTVDICEYGNNIITESRNHGITGV